MCTVKSYVTGLRYVGISALHILHIGQDYVQTKLMWLVPSNIAMMNALKYID